MKPEFEKLIETEDLFKKQVVKDIEQQQQLNKKGRKLNVFDPTKVLEYYNLSMNHKMQQAMEDEIKHKIIDFARGLEMDKNKDYQ